MKVCSVNKEKLFFFSTTINLSGNLREGYTPNSKRKKVFLPSPNLKFKTWSENEIINEIKHILLARLFISLILSVPEKLKNSIFEIPIIPQTLNINN